MTHRFQTLAKETPVKEFITAVEDIEAEDLVEYKKDADGQFIIDQDGNKIVEEKYIAFQLDGHELHAYPPLDGQLAFMLAALGRGQTADQRFAAIINIMLSSLRDEDADYMEGRLLSRDPKKRLPVKKIEEIFEFLTVEWFARPTQPPSDSASSQPSDGPKSLPSITTPDTPSSESDPIST
jgi:hypothetical protein